MRFWPQGSSCPVVKTKNMSVSFGHQAWTFRGISPAMELERKRIFSKKVTSVEQYTVEVEDKNNDNLFKDKSTQEKDTLGT